MADERESADFPLHPGQILEAADDDRLRPERNPGRAHPGETELEPEEKLGRGIVQFARNPPPLLLLRPEDPPGEPAPLATQVGEIRDVVDAGENEAMAA